MGRIIIAGSNERRMFICVKWNQLSECFARERHARGEKVVFAVSIDPPVVNSISFKLLYNGRYSNRNDELQLF